MSAAIEIKLDGMKEELEKIAEKLLDHSLYYVETRAKRNAPKDTGYMSQRIYSKHEGLKGEVVSPAFYSGFIEYGTGNIHVGTPKQPRKEWDALVKRGAVGSGQIMPFMRPAIYTWITHMENMSKQQWNTILR